jgi:hypothetical protein
MATVSRLGGILLVLMACLLGACGGDEKAKAPPGSAENPLVAKAEPDASSGQLNESAGKQGGGSGSGSGSDSSSGSDSTGRGGGGQSGGSSSTGAPSGRPGYQDLVKGQSAKPKSAFTPCNLVTKAQASDIVGKPIKDPLEAPQGPTCIYQPASGKTFITVAVQAVEFGKLKRHLGQPTRFTVAKRTAYCGQYGKAVLYVPLSKGRVLSITGPCKVAKQFASAAVRRLG